MIVMYKYTFILDTGRQDHMVGDTFSKVLSEYFQLRGNDILQGSQLKSINVNAYPNATGTPVAIEAYLIDKIIASFKQQNAPAPKTGPAPAPKTGPAPAPKTGPAPKLYKGVDLNKFSDTDIITLSGNDKNYNILKSWFPDNIKNKNKLQITKESIYSLSLKDHAEKLTDRIRKLFDDLAMLDITDATANVGGNTLNFAKYFNHVNSVEIDKQTCNALENNVNIAGYNNVSVFNRDYLEIMNKLTQDVLFFDPPWGGVDYWQEKELMLKLGDKPLYEIINKLETKPRLIVIKAPKNFAFDEFKQKLVCGKCIVSKEAFYNHQIIIIEFPRDLQKELCEDMRTTCPDGSKNEDPIMYEDWCTEIPYKEFVKNNKDLSQCYRLSGLLAAFKAGLEATKNDAPMPQWPVDPLTNLGLSEETIQNLYKQAIDAEIDIPELFVEFMDALDQGLFDVNAARKGQYIGGTDKISEEYRKGFIEPAVEVLFGKQSNQTQEDLDLQMAVELSQQLNNH